MIMAGVKNERISIEDFLSYVSVKYPMQYDRIVQLIAAYKIETGK